VLTLFETLFAIIRLKKGPDAIPYSWLLCLITMTMWLFAGLAMTAIAAGLACYASIIVLSGRTPRLLQTVTAILGCGAVLSLLFIAGNALLAPILGENVTSLVVTLILLWSIPVEGHIIARAIDQHWYVGIVAAMAVFVFQLFLYSLLNPAAGTVT
jgi:hypothetical protein